MNQIFTLQNGVTIPSIGLGTWQSESGEIAYNAVKQGIQAGYRHIDTAAVYGNEKSVGSGIKDSGVPREELFVTSKVWNSQRGFAKTLAAFETTLSDLQLDYLDLYLIHWPANKKQFHNWQEINRETWKALEKLYKEGKIRAIGVSNFLPHHLDALFDDCEIRPMVNQIEFHPGFMQEETVRYCMENHLLVEAWSPLGTGKMLTNETLQKIAAKYQRSVAQLCVKWVLQHDILPLPKSVTLSRMQENMDVCNFEITEEDMKIIDALPYSGGSGLNPDKIDF